MRKFNVKVFAIIGNELELIFEYKDVFVVHISERIYEINYLNESDKFDERIHIGENMLLKLTKNLKVIHICNVNN